jgi:hypothetical protein
MRTTPASRSAELPGRTLRPGPLGPGEAVGREQVLGCHVEDLSLLEAGRVHALRRLDAEVEGVEGAEDLVDGADLGLVLEVDAAVELGEATHVGALDHELVLGLVQEGAVRDDVGGRTLVETPVVIEGSAATPTASAAAE